MASNNTGNGAKTTRKTEQVNQMMEFAYGYSRKFETQEHKSCFVVSSNGCRSGFKKYYDFC